MRAIKKIKRIFGIMGNCLLIPLIFPMTISSYIKRIPLLSPVISFANIIVWFCILLFAFGFTIDKLGLSNNLTGWQSTISKNPYQYIRNSFFLWNMIILDLFFMVAIVKSWWNIDELKKDLSVWIYNGLER